MSRSIIRLPALMNTQYVIATKLQLLFDWDIGWYVGLHIISIYPVHASPTQSRGAQKPHDLIREKDVDVRCQHERRTSPANADVFGNHLKQRQLIAVLKPTVNLRRDFNDAHIATSVLHRVR